MTLLPGRAIGARLCGGMAPRQRDQHDIAGNTMALHGRQGCGHHVAVVHVDATPAPDAETRPLFVKSAPAVLCPHCDTGGPMPQPEHAELARLESTD